ncbi:hypothetical protein [Desulfotomaculum sp. 1211_IL3151]|uniref:hypothetical protein n=1 Tax=Desulfotomaculum sp. 1211_IL3151 TaxID=3084055 RepID=UPI002FDA116A
MVYSFWHKVIASILFCLCTLGPVNFASADANEETVERVVLVVIDKLTIQDYEAEGLANLKALANQGALGLLNNNTGAGIYSEHTYSTIGGGAHLVGNGEVINGFNIEEKFSDLSAGDEYFLRTGLHAPEDSVVQLAIGKLIRTNGELRHPAIPGALGQAINDAGKKTAVVGNSDTIGTERRLITTISMNELGVTDMGTVDRSILLQHQENIGSYRTDFVKVLAKIKEYREKAALIVVETGDLTRLYEERDKATEQAYQRQRQEAKERIDQFVGKLASSMDFSKEALIVVTPTPTTEAVKGNISLTPIIALGPKWEPGTLLTSGTTKRDGIIMNTDIAPTILRSLGVQPVPEMSGRPFMSSQAHFTGNSLDYLLDLNKGLVTTYQARPPLQSAYVFLQLIVLLMGLYGIFLKKHMAEVIKPFLLLVMSVPLVELMMPLLPKISVTVMAVQLVILTLAFSGIAILLQRKIGIDPFIFICLATAGTILADLLNASFLLKQSVLGYDPIVGARFYGIGNEYMGVLIGSLIIGTTAAIQYLEKYRRTLIILSGFFYLFTIYAMAAPNLGTNVGGTIAATAGLLVTFLLLIGVRFRFTTVVLVGCLVVLSVTGFIAFDLSRPVDLRSHMGTTAALLLQDPNHALQVIQRKWSMNMKLLRYTVWSRVLLASLGILALLFYRPQGVVKNLRVEYPYLFKGFIGVITGALVAFAFNDSGVVAAATTMIFGAPPLVYLVLSEQKNKHKHIVK